VIGGKFSSTMLSQSSSSPLQASPNAGHTAPLQNVDQTPV
jgi:hypothetical protein